MTRRIVSTPGLMGGYPCFEGTRVPWDTPLRIVDFKYIFPEDVPTFYPSLDAEAYDTAVAYLETPVRTEHVWAQCDDDPPAFFCEECLACTCCGVAVPAQCERPTVEAGDD